MINHADIENIIGCKTLVTDRMQRAIEDWYDAAINGLPLDKNPETLTLDLPALICAELARLTTLELEATVEGAHAPQTAHFYGGAGPGQRHLETLPERQQAGHLFCKRNPVLPGRPRCRGQFDRGRVHRHHPGGRQLLPPFGVDARSGAPTGSARCRAGATGGL